MSSALTAILQHSGYDVDSVYDGQAAMEKALENVYDCLIFDIMMPKMSGIEALKIIEKARYLYSILRLFLSQKKGTKHKGIFDTVKKIESSKKLLTFV